VAARQQVTFKPTLALVFAEHLHHPAIGTDVVVDGNGFRSRATVRHLEHGGPAIRRGFVRAEDAEVACVGVELEHIADKLTLDACAFGLHDSGLLNLYRVISEIRYSKGVKKYPSIGMRVRSHAPRSFGR